MLLLPRGRFGLKSERNADSFTGTSGQNSDLGFSSDRLKFIHTCKYVDIVVPNSNGATRTCAISSQTSLVPRASASVYTHCSGVDRTDAFYALRFGSGPAVTSYRNIVTILPRAG